MTLRVFIPTAGIGSRVYKYSKFFNKSLITLGQKPVISHIIDKFPEKTEFVIALGYKGRLVRDFLEIAYPKKKFFFKYIKNYKGRNSGLGLTLMNCYKFLQQPFIFISCDTVFLGKIPKLNYNWVAYGETFNKKNYRTIIIKKKKVLEFLEKNEIKKNSKAYIGFCGVKDYKVFWKDIFKNKKKVIKQGEVFGLKNLIKLNIKSVKLSWYDTGNINSLIRAKKYFKNKNDINILEKDNETIWFIGDKVIKFSTDVNFIKNRILRQKILRKYTPNILKYKKNFYYYKKIKAKTFSSVVSKKLFKKLLSDLKLFWKEYNLKKNKKFFYKKCLFFYKKKTIDRINLFNSKFKKKDTMHFINSEKISSIKTLFKKVDWNNLSKGIPVNFHGDLHFENILVLNNKKFIFLDWRQDFEGSLNIGDIYYDFAKIMHGIIISHEIISKNQFKVNWNKNCINYTFKLNLSNKKILKNFESWLLTNNYDLNKVRIITALIYLNIAALHHYPYCLLLFSLGKKLLQRALENEKYL